MAGRFPASNGADPAAAPLLVIGIGNPSRGDDALGPACVAALEARALAGVELLTDFQLQIEHVLDLARCRRALFVDASVNCATPFVFQAVEPDLRASHSHALSPGELLGVYRRVNAEPSPPADLLAIRGYEFELGAPLSSAARANLEAAVRFLIPRLPGSTQSLREVT